MIAPTYLVYPRSIQSSCRSGNDVPCPPLLWWLQVEELYSILRVVKELTLYCQREDEATAEGGMNRMMLLLTDTLEPTKPLEIVHVRQIGEAGAAGATGAAHTMRAHADLKPLGRKIREVFRNAVGSRFLPRYTPAGLRTHAHLFDHAMFLSPSSRNMMYIDMFVASTAAEGRGLATSQAIKDHIKEDVVKQVAAAITELRSRAAAAREREGVQEVQLTRTPRAVAESSSIAKRLKAAGCVDDMDSDSDDSDGEQKGSSARERPPEEEAKAIVDDWLRVKVRVGPRGSGLAMIRVVS